MTKRPISHIFQIYRQAYLTQIRTVSKCTPFYPRYTVRYHHPHQRCAAIKRIISNTRHRIRYLYRNHVLIILKRVASNCCYRIRNYHKSLESIIFFQHPIFDYKVHTVVIKQCVAIPVNGSVI